MMSKDKELALACIQIQACSKLLESTHIVASVQCKFLARKCKLITDLKLTMACIHLHLLIAIGLSA